MILKAMNSMSEYAHKVGDTVGRLAFRLEHQTDKVAENAESIQQLRKLLYQQEDRLEKRIDASDAGALRTEFNANLETVARLAKDNQHRQTLNEGVDGKLGQSIATLAHRVEQLQLWRDNSGGGDKLVHTVVEITRRLGVVERLFEHEGVTEFFEKMPGNLATVMSMVEENQRRLDKLDPEKPDDYDGEVYP